MAVTVMLAGLSIVSATTIAIVPVLNGLIERQRARSAADAAALAGVTGGRGASSALAADNGGELIRFERVGREVTVWVRVGGSSASARATDEP
jgi:predicted MarR family transcription regulator